MYYRSTDKVLGWLHASAPVASLLAEFVQLNQFGRSRILRVGSESVCETQVPYLPLVFRHNLPYKPIRGIGYIRRYGINAANDNLGQRWGWGWRPRRAGLRAAGQQQT